MCPEMRTILSDVKFSLDYEGGCQLLEWPAPVGLLRRQACAFPSSCQAVQRKEGKVVFPWQTLKPPKESSYSPRLRGPLGLGRAET